MSNHVNDFDVGQMALFDTDATRSLLDQLLIDSKLYTQSADYKDLLDFVVRLREFAPFNAMLLQVQKPGLRYAASKKDWCLRFRRRPKEGARPLLILWPFGPVALVYDVTDTEGDPLPEDVSSFVARGQFDQAYLDSFEAPLRQKNISILRVDSGDRKAGLIRVVHRASGHDDVNRYQININQNHSPVVQFNTLTHELGHLFLGHLGPDKKLSIPYRRQMDHANQEIEAESVAYIICQRNNIEPKSQSYLSAFVNADKTLEDIDVYQIMRAAGQVESMLGLAKRQRFQRA